MSHASTIAAVRQSIVDVFSELDACFDRPADERAFRPASGGWTIDEILEHVALANSFLMLTWRKAIETALRRAAEGERIPEGESDLARLRAVGERGTFEWARPEHMTPGGRASSGDVQGHLRRQRDECLSLLDRIGQGEGALVRLHMSVNALGRIDLYQWLYFLAQHARRHLQQISSAGGDRNSRGPRAEAPENHPMSIDETTSVVRQYITEVWNQGDLAALERLTVPAFTYHLGGQPPRDRAAMAEFLREMRVAFPDWHVDIADLLVDGNLAAVRWQGQVTHAGPFRGIPATGRRIAVSGINVYHVSGGRITAEWEQTDSLSMLQQIGVVRPA